MATAPGPRRGLGGRVRRLRARPSSSARRALRAADADRRGAAARRGDHDEPRLAAGRHHPQRGRVSRARGAPPIRPRSQVDLGTGRLAAGRQRSGAQALGPGRACACRRSPSARRSTRRCPGRASRASARSRPAADRRGRWRSPSALGAAVWQRRARLAALKIQGFDDRQLWRALLIEGAIVLASAARSAPRSACYGHALANRYLEMTTGFPAPFSIAGGSLLLHARRWSCGIALAIYVVPGWAAARVPRSRELSGVADTGLGGWQAVPWEDGRPSGAARVRGRSPAATG